MLTNSVSVIGTRGLGMVLFGSVFHEANDLIVVPTADTRRSWRCQRENTRCHRYYLYEYEYEEYETPFLNEIWSRCCESSSLIDYNTFFRSCFRKILGSKNWVGFHVTWARESRLGRSMVDMAGCCVLERMDVRSVRDDSSDSLCASGADC